MLIRESGSHSKTGLEHFRKELPTLFCDLGVSRNLGYDLGYLVGFAS